MVTGDTWGCTATPGVNAPKHMLITGSHRLTDTDIPKITPSVLPKATTTLFV